MTPNGGGCPGSMVRITQGMPPDSQNSEAPYVTRGTLSPICFSMASDNSRDTSSGPGAESKQTDRDHNWHGGGNPWEEFSALR